MYRTRRSLKVFKVALAGISILGAMLILHTPPSRINGTSTNAEKPSDIAASAQEILGDDTLNSTGARKHAGQLLRVQYGGVSNRCVTPQGVCFMPRYAPIGSPCWCQTPYGSAQGYAG